MITELEKKVKREEWKISYKQLGLLILFFLVGLITALLFDNAQVGESTTFTTTELVGFVLAVILSGASIVLAVSAIAFGKTSEQAVVCRSDESIKSQNEVFLKTMEALQQIEARAESTGKRFEDIITSRIDDISRKIAKYALRGKEGMAGNFQEVEEEVRNLIQESIKEEKVKSISIEQYQEKKTEPKAGDDLNEKEYQGNHKKLLKAFAERGDLEVVKTGHGRITEAGDDLFDGIFKKENARIGVSTFRSDSNGYKFQVYLLNAAQEIEKGHVDQIVVICFKTGDEDRLLEMMKSSRDQLKGEVKDKISITCVPPGNIDEEVRSLSVSDDD